MTVSKVKRIRMTGLGKRKPKRIANVVLSNNWLGKKVVVVEYLEFMSMKKEISTTRTKMKNINNLSS